MPDVPPNGASADQLGHLVDQNRIRLGAALVFGLAAWLVVDATPDNQVWRMVILGPVLLGALIPLLSQPPLSSSINAWKAHFEKGRAEAEGKQTTYAKYFSRPLHNSSLGLWDASEPIRDVHVRAGVRLAALAGFWVWMIAFLVVAIYAVIAVVVLGLIFAAYSWLSHRSDSPSRSYGSTLSGKPIGTSPFGSSSERVDDQEVGRIDGLGNVHSESGLASDEKIGRVDGSGTAPEGTGLVPDDKDKGTRS